MGRSGDVEQFANSLETADAPVEKTGFLENIGPAFDVFMDNNTSISSFLNNDAYEERNRDIDRMIRRGQVSNEQVEAASGMFGVEYDKLAYDLKRSGHDIRDDYDVRESIRSTLETQRNEAAAIHERAGGMGTLGMFIGQMAAAQLDPVNIGSMFIPGLAMVRQGSALARAGKSAVYYGGTSAAAEAAIQPFVHDWQRELGTDYSVGDSLTNIALAGAGGAVIGTGIEMGVQAVSNGFKRMRANANKQNAPPEVLEEIDAAEAEFTGAVNATRMEEALDVLDELEETILTKDFDSDEAFLDALEEGVPPPLDDPADLGLEADMREAEVPIQEFSARVNKAREEFMARANEEIANRGVIPKIDIFIPEELRALRKTGPVRNDGEAANAEYDAVVAKLDEVQKAEEIDLLDEDTSNEMWAAHDDDKFMEMTPEQRDEYVSRMLGEDDLDGEIEWETGQLDQDGNMAYASKSPEEIRNDIADAEDGLSAFETCWMGGDGEE